MSNCKRYTDAELQQFLSDGIALLQKENADLRKDKLRLDWLADVNQTVGSVLLTTGIVERNLSSLRDALDEAMRIEQ